MKTYVATDQTVKRGWFLIDAANKPLGRLASELARRLRGKHKPEFTPHVDTGDYLVVINAEKIAASGKKMSDKMYYRHTGYPGGIREASLSKMLLERPEKVLRLAVKGMMPRGPLGRAMLRKLKIFAGTEHEHAAQQPEPLNLED